MKSTTIPARKTIYNGVTMRSRLEAGFAMWLDRRGWAWEYEPTCFASKNGQWLPDFAIDIPCVSMDGPHGVTQHTNVYVEVKPAIHGAPEGRGDVAKAELDETYRRMLTAHETDVRNAVILARESTNPVIVHPDYKVEVLDWTWTGLWPVDARRVEAPWSGEWWRGFAA